MRKKIEWVQYELVLKTPFTVSYGSSSTRTAFLIRTDDGGFGEGTIPFYYGIPFAAMTSSTDVIRALSVRERNSATTDRKSVV